MKKMLGMVVSLTVIAAVCAGVLSYVNAVTSGPIAATAKSNEVAAIRSVMPAEVATVKPLDGVADAFVGFDAAGAKAGYAAKGRDSHGYGGEIVLMVGFEKDARTLVTFRTLAASETPGLGMKLKAPEFADRFRGCDGASVKVRKDGGGIEAITSATITSRAVCRAIVDAQKKLSE